MTDLVKVHQTPDGNCGIYSIACQFASLHVQAELQPEIKEQLTALYKAHEEAFIGFFHCLNRFHHIPDSRHLNAQNFGQFIQKNIHTYRDLELFVGPAMRFFFENQQAGSSKEDEVIILTLVNLKKEHTETFNLYTLCKVFGLKLITYLNGTVNATGIEDFSAILDEAPHPAAFTIRLLHSGGNHFDSVYHYQEMLDLKFNLMVAELEETVMYVDSNEPAVLKGCDEISGEQIWRRDHSLFLDKIILAPKVQENESNPLVVPQYQTQIKKHATSEEVNSQVTSVEATEPKQIHKKAKVAPVSASSEENPGVLSRMSKYFFG